MSTLLTQKLLNVSGQTVTVRGLNKKKVSWSPYSAINTQKTNAIDGNKWWKRRLRHDTIPYLKPFENNFYCKYLYTYCMQLLDTMQGYYWYPFTF